MCPSSAAESASSSPSNSARADGVAAAGSPYAPSTCSHTPWRAHTSAIARIGSTAPVSVVPALATTATGTRPSPMSCSSAAASMSVRMPRFESISIVRSDRRPKPSTSTARSTLECASTLV